VAYRAEIEIGVKGIRSLEQLRSEINKSAQAADSLADALSSRGRLTQSLNAYESLLSKASKTLKQVTAGTQGETRAIREYVTILGQSNEAQARQNKLIEREIALRNRLKDAGPRTALRAQERSIFVEETISRGRSARIARERSAFLQGPGRTVSAEASAQLAIQESKRRQEAFKAQDRFAREIFNIERNFDKKINDSKIDNMLKTFKLEEDMQIRLFNKALDLDKKEGAAFDTELRRRTAAKEAAFEKERKIAEQVARSSPIGGAEDIPGSPAFLRARSRRRREAASNALIGGAFPLLFGQGIGAAAGGAIGGGAGGLLGGQFGFGLSLVGTAAGSAIDTLVAKAAELGKALDPVSGNVDTIIQSLGLVNTATGKYIKRLEEVAGKQVALEEATKQLALVVGDEGVQALKEFGEATKDLGNAVSKFITQIAADAAKLLQPATRATGNVISVISEQRAALSSSDPRLAGLQQEFTQNTGERTRAEITAELLETYREITKEAEKEAKAKLAALDPSNAALKTAERRLEIEQLNGDILNDQVFNLEKQQLAADLIADRTDLRRKAEGDVALQATLQNKLKKRQLDYEKDLVALINKRGDAEEEAAKKARRAMERRMREFKRLQEKEQREAERRNNQFNSSLLFFNSVYSERQNLFDQVVKIQKGEEEMLIRQNKDAVNRLEIEKHSLKIKQDKRIEDAKSVQEELMLDGAFVIQNKNLQLQFDLKEALRNQTLARLRAEKLVTEELQEQERQTALRDIDRSIQRIDVGIASPFSNEGEQQLLLLEQQFRREDQIAQGKVKLLNLEKELLSTTEDTSDSVIKDLQRNIAVEKAFQTDLQNRLDILDLAEQKQLNLNQTIEKYGFLANELSTAMTSAVQAVVTGTGTVEEAFSTMFANIGKAFIDMATQMMAQKLFMTVLGALGGGGGFSFAGGSASSGLSAANLMGGTGPLNAGLFGRASGGSVLPGSTYMVGERGPELLTMTPSGGYVTNNSASQAAMDRYSSGNTRGGAISVNYNVTEINGMKFVTEDQFRAGISQAAKQGADGGFNRTMSSLKNSRSTRSRVGV